MVRLLTTTALLSALSTSAFANIADIRDSLQNIYTDFGANWSATVDGTDAASELGELAHMIDNKLTLGTVDISPVGVDTEFTDTNSTRITPLPTTATVDPDTGEFALDEILIQAQVFVDQLVLETVYDDADNDNNDGFVQQHLNNIIARVNDVNAKIVSANTGRPHAADGIIYTGAQALEARTAFIEFYEGDEGAAKFNNAVTELANIARSVTNITEVEDLDAFTLNLDNKTDIQSHIDWVNNIEPDSPEPVAPEAGEAYDYHTGEILTTIPSDLTGVYNGIVYFTVYQDGVVIGSTDDFQNALEMLEAVEGPATNS